MPHVRFGEAYLQAVTGRDVESAVHPEDDSGFGVGQVDDVRPSDTVISEAEYGATVAHIQAYNAALPAPEGPVVTPDPNLEALRTLLAIDDATLTTAEVKEITLRLARHLDAKGRL